MKQAIFILLLAGYLLGPACQHPEVTNPIEPEPIDTTHILTCEDTIEINFPGEMVHGYISAVKTCRPWIASAQANIPGTSTDHLFISGETYYPFISTNGDTTYLTAEGIAFTIPRRIGKFPIVNLSGFHKDTARCGYSYVDNDVFLADWNIDTTFLENEIEVTDLDMIQKRVKGKFNIHFKIDTNSAHYEWYPPNFYFYEGKFDVEIID